MLFQPRMWVHLIGHFLSSVGLPTYYLNQFFAMIQTQNTYFIYVVNSLFNFEIPHGTKVYYTYWSGRRWYHFTALSKLFDTSMKAMFLLKLTFQVIVVCTSKSKGLTIARAEISLRKWPFNFMCLCFSDFIIICDEEKMNIELFRK